MNLEEFAKDFLEDVLARAEALPEGEFLENAFARIVMEWLVDFGECEDPEVCYFKGVGMKINGWELHEENDSLDLFVCALDAATPVYKVSKADMTDVTTRCRRFLSKAVRGLMRDLEESSPAFEAAQRIAASARSLRQVRMYVITNGMAPAEPVPDIVVDGLPVTHHIWDIERLYQSHSRSRAAEVLDIGSPDLDGGIPCVKILGRNAVYQAYVGVIPGQVLARLYEKWGHRLLERNLRSWLQTRGAVNKGIRDTLLENPEMFLAYNNGISTTADSADIVLGEDGQHLIRRLRNFQIVNGGQTTATIYDAAHRYGADLSAVYVQVKVTVLTDPTEVDEHVPLISRYANTQNKVNLSDFSANHPFHVELERFSRNTWVPNPDQRGKATTKWYYERARGQYMNDLRAAGTRAQREAFKIRFPSKHRFTKTDAAKYEMAWMQYPHIVCLGAEKNFAHLMSSLSDAGGFTVDELYFRNLVAKGILFRRCDDVVRRAEYQGYKAQIVAYGVASLSHQTAQLLDLDRIWDQQDISPTVGDALKTIVESVQAHITTPPKDGMNISEWCKKRECWESLLEKEMALPDLSREMVDISKRTRSPVTAYGEDREPTAEEEEMIRRITEVPKDVWFGLAAWARQTSNLRPWERSLAYSLGTLVARRKRPSRKQAVHGVRILKEAQAKGFRIPGVRK